jgi:hypothetical protein
MNLMISQKEFVKICGRMNQFVYSGGKQAIPRLSQNERNKEKKRPPWLMCKTVEFPQLMKSGNSYLVLS